ncbi:MAG: RecQ family ATP-dependent DNA helicase [bacterium]|nr:RecQ family ATP-dependent DNA helicase [bacterium]
MGKLNSKQNHKERATQLLKTALGNPDAEFRDGQWDAIKEVCENHGRVLIVQRTGWGKSMVYFIATKILRESGKGPTILISPLLSLMRNQMAADAANNIGLRTDSITSENKPEWEDVTKRLLADQIDLLLVSPERLANTEFREKTLLPLVNNIGLFVVDEAHCISDWGHDFRPDYLRIARIINLLPPNSPVLATTATANQRVIDDIVRQFGDSLITLRGPLIRHSLSLQNITFPSKSQRMAWLADKLPKLEGSGIIYTLTIRDAKRLAEWLRLNGIEAYEYHSELKEIRPELEKKLMNNEIKALVATVALGMGFDKPDLGFVIHFQRPGSVVHYYQQVGRAGRKVDNAYGILLSGEEDDEITDYFIRTAFPPEEHVHAILDALEKAEEGLTIRELGRVANINYGNIEKALRILSVQQNAPVIYRDKKWHRTVNPFVIDRDMIDKIMAHRRREQKKMLEYIGTDKCLMEFLSEELNDPYAAPCGRCANCIGKPIIDTGYPENLVIKATEFLNRSDIIIEPRKKMPSYKNINKELLAEEGRALCMWGDPGWGDMIRKGKKAGNISDELVNAVAEMILNRWRPDPFPEWIACVPSLNRPELVPDFASRLSKKIGVPFRNYIIKVRETSPQKLMQNSQQQYQNIKNAFKLSCLPPEFKGPVLLVDDLIDSKWTMTFITALLRTKGSGIVYPMAIAVSTPSYYAPDER